LQTYLYTYSLLRGVTFEVCPFSSYVLSQMMLPLLETFMELFLWNSIQCHHYTFFGCLQYPEIFIPLRQTLFCKQPEVIWRSQITGKGWMFHFSNSFLGHKPLDRECLMSWSSVMVENPNVELNFRPFSIHSFT